MRVNFTKWLKNRVSKDYAKQLISYLDKFVDDVIIKNTDDLIEIIENSTSKKNIILALRKPMSLEKS